MADRVDDEPTTAPPSADYSESDSPSTTDIVISAAVIGLLLVVLLVSLIILLLILIHQRKHGVPVKKNVSIRYGHSSLDRETENSHMEPNPGSMHTTISSPNNHPSGNSQFTDIDQEGTEGLTPESTQTVESVCVDSTIPPTERTADLNPEGSLAETENVAMEPNPAYSALSNEREREIQLEPNPVYSMHTANAHSNSPFYHRTTDLNPEGSLPPGTETENVVMEPNPVYSALSYEREREIQLEPNPVYSMHTQTRANTHNLAPGGDLEYDYVPV